MSRRLATLVFLATASWLGWSAFSGLRQIGFGPVRSANEGAQSESARQSPLASADQSTAIVKDITSSDHVGHPKQLADQASRRPLAPATVDFSVDRLGRAHLDWSILRGAKLVTGKPPIFPGKLAEWDGKPVTLTGFMAPLDEFGEVNTFLLLELPWVCLFCLSPSPAEMVQVQLADQDRRPLSHDLVKITGILHLNADDPEGFLFSMDQASVGGVE